MARIASLRLVRIGDQIAATDEPSMNADERLTHKPVKIMKIPLPEQSRMGDRDEVLEHEIGPHAVTLEPVEGIVFDLAAFVVVVEPLLPPRLEEAHHAFGRQVRRTPLGIDSVRVTDDPELLPPTANRQPERWRLTTPVKGFTPSEPAPLAAPPRQTAR